VLDVDKWRNGFLALSYDVPDFDEDFRFSLRIVDQQNADYFLKCMSRYEISKEILSSALALEYPSAKSWWDVQHLFPIMFVDFDECTVGAFYYDGICMERYVPNNCAVNSLILLMNILKKNSLVQISFGYKMGKIC
jgi:hypothetical protein